MNRRPTLAQVALRAGVSRTTASYVLSGNKKLSDETRAKVLAAAEELGYRIDPRARNLRRMPTQVLGALMIDSADNQVEKQHSLFWVRWTYYFAQACSERGFVASFASQARAQELIDSGIDVLMLIGVPPEGILDDLEIPFGLPVVAMDSIQDVPTTVIGHDARAIAAEVVGHFVRQGAKQVGFCAAEEARPTLGYWPEAFAQECDRLGVLFRNVWFDANDSGLEDAVKELLDSGTDALFTLPGYISRLHTAIRLSGRTMPDDLLLVVQSEGLVEAALTPTISTLSLCARESAYELVRITAEHLQTAEVAHFFLPFELQVRESSNRIK